MNYVSEPIFKNKAGVLFPGFLKEQLSAMRAELFGKYGITQAQVSEAASYSMAMVIRYALGLTSEGGVVGALVSDTLAGYTALATVRHLVNSGASAHIRLLRTKQHSPELTQQLQPLKLMEVEIVEAEPSQLKAAQLSQLFSTCHNVVCGLYDPELATDPLNGEMIEALNELSTPIHCIDAPLGIDVNSGAPGPAPLYASSTLSMGAPLCGLFAGRDFVGRHYLCDISFSSKIYMSQGFDLAPLFSEQPVLQIFPNEETQS